MNIPGRPRPSELRLAEERAANALDRYLDGLNDGAAPAAANDDLAPALAATARTVHGPAAGAATDPDRATEDRLWRDLRRTQHRPAIVALPATPRPVVTLPASTARPLPSAASRRRGSGGRQPGRFWAFGGVLGVIATICLVALVAMSAFSLYLNAPPPDSTPTVSLAGYAVTPTVAGVAAAGTPSGIVTPGSVPPDLVRPVVQACTAIPRTMDETIAIIARPYDAQPTGQMRMAVPPRLLPWTVNQDGGRWLERTTLPQGSMVEQPTIDALVLVFGAWSGCVQQNSNYTLTAIALLSDDGVTRLFWQRSDREPDAYSVVRLGAPDNLPPVFAVQPGQPGRDYLWGFRTLPDGRVVAHLATNTSGTPDVEPDLAVDQGGYVVFIETPSGWLIDELSMVELG